MNTYRITCREYVCFVKEVKAKSEDEAREKLHNFALPIWDWAKLQANGKQQESIDNVNGFKTFSEWTEVWEIANVRKRK
jgi:hypothetical protein|tara:strand:+ start:164 stop:400 length:237 start_codon:yes stop_codon:yes gene_type:complete